jgi:oligopeptidase A
VRPEHVAPALDELLGQADRALAAVTRPEFPADWNAMARELDVATERLGRAWGMVGHLNAVADTPELRAAYNEALPRVTEFWTRLGADEKLFAKYKAVDPAKLSPEQRQALKNALRNFTLSGADLVGAAKERFAQIQERQAELSQKFSEHALDATDAFAYYAGEEELDGVPPDVVQAARAAAEAEGKGGHKLTLKMPSYLPVMQFGHNRTLRERLHRAYVTRASDQGDPKFDNTPLIREILALRQEEARLLGYRSFAEVSVVPKMAESPEQVIRFLRDLAAPRRPYALKDVEDMRAFARTGWASPTRRPGTGLHRREAEGRALRLQRAGGQAVLHRAQGARRPVQDRRDAVRGRDPPRLRPAWNPGVEFYRIERGGDLVGQFYLDPSARTGKRGGAWMDDVRARWLRPDDGRCRRPSPTSCATSPRAWTASRRC